MKNAREQYAILPLPSSSLTVCTGMIGAPVSSQVQARNRREIDPSERQRLGGDAELLRVLRDDADGQEAEDEIVGLIVDDLMIVQVPDGADRGGAVAHSAGESGDL